MVFFTNSKLQHSTNESYSSSDDSLVSPPDTPRSSLQVIVSDEMVLLAVDWPKHRAGRKKFKETRHPVYRGVRQRKNDKWVSEIREPNKKTRIWLGTYPTAEMAARAHDVASLALRGRLACLNFADSVWRLPVPDSATAKDIRKTATEAAQIFQGLKSVGIPLDKITMKPEIGTVTTNNMLYMDDEVEFGLPGLLANMAQGLLLAPPPSMGFGISRDVVEVYADMSLWTSSI
ncbi:hypothetical protein GIB67_019249 [Kingdonia uniflora]|uniref:AP2/ERF domain-containing protein n=1 Tax=Kingdonia uniflora TaxID=39325 RepID=A0A7J7N0D1_9MAGN|nr:hypothetical protein GIB67_019249 [Kingdonia uniflora]